METRKYQLQKQILEALKANDSDLYSLLKSQWAHRFGVESLEELKNLDASQLNQNQSYLNNQKTNQLQENSFEANKAVFVKDEDNQEKVIKSNELESQKEDIDGASKIKSYEKLNKESLGSKTKITSKYINNAPEIEALIPLPPKPKYGYLKKWMLRK